MTEQQSELDEDLDVFEHPEAEPVISLSTHCELPAAGLLSVQDADALLRWRTASVIAIVGERNGGKTTLVTEIYTQFLRGPFADLWFSHSLSLLGFEKKCFQSRAGSGAERPDTPRTSAQEGLSFFHLQLADPTRLENKTDLLISERAGESYRDVRERPQLAEQLLEIQKAAVIVLIIDGERVANARQRAGVFASVRNIAQALVHSGAVKADTVIQLVTTKYDLLEGDAAAARDALTDFEVNVVKLFGDRFSVVSFRTAARDPNGLIAPATGLAPLLRSWLEPRETWIEDAIQLPDLVSEFDKLLLRRTMQ